MSDQFTTQFDAMAPALFMGAGLRSYAAKFRRKDSGVDIDCTVLVDETTQFQGDLTQVPQRSIVLTAYAKEIGSADPIASEKFTIAETQTVYSVDSILNQDDSRFVLSVVECS